MHNFTYTDGVGSVSLTGLGFTFLRSSAGITDYSRLISNLIGIADGILVTWVNTYHNNHILSGQMATKKAHQRDQISQLQAVC